VRVDLNDPDRLAAFCDGCRIVVNCAGPTYQVLDTVARAAFATGADYVDVGGELAAKDALTGHDVPEDRRAVFSAGVMPGLSGLLPRLLAKGRPLRRLDVYVGGAAVFTPLSAVDALLTRGPRFGTPMAAWRAGRVAPNTLAPLHDVRLPGFPVPVHAWPYLTTEAQTLAMGTGADEVRSYNVFVTDRLPEALAASWAQLPDTDPVTLDPATLAPHADAVVRASWQDNADFGAFYVMLFTARPHPGAAHRGGLLRAQRGGDGARHPRGADRLRASRSPPGGRGPGSGRHRHRTARRSSGGRAHRQVTASYRSGCHGIHFLSTSASRSTP
jgi:hypothetical protein